MKLHVLGSGTCMPYLRRGSSGYSLILSKSKLLFDCGNGTTWKLGKIGINYLDIDHIFISHFHPDHTADLIPFLFANKYSQGLKREKPLTIWGAFGLNDFFSSLKGAYNGWIDFEQLKINEIQEDTIEFEDFLIKTCRANHIESSIAYRIEADGKSLVYTGDTDYTEDIIGLAHRADALIIECSTPDELKLPGHLTPSEAGKIGKCAKVKRLILTHMYPVCDKSDIKSKIMDQFDEELIISEDLMEINI